VLKRIFVDNMQSGKILQRVNPQDLLRDLTKISELPSFVPTLKQLKKPDEAVKGYVATVQETASEMRRVGRYDPATNPNGVRDINMNLYDSKGKKLDDLDLISDGTVWEIKVGKQNNWNSPDLDGWIDLAVDYAKQNGLKKVGFRLDADALANKWNTPAFQKVLAKKRAQYQGQVEILDPLTITAPPIP
jgi:hypothetical protein